MDVARLGPADVDLVRPAWLALCARLGDLETGMGPLRSPEELWKRRRERYAGWLRREPSAIFVAREGDELLGYAMVQARDAWHVRHTSDPTAELQTLSVLPAVQGRGVGAAVLAAAVDHLRRHGVRDVTVGVSTVNEGAQRFYARHGFRPLLSTWWARPVPELDAPEDVDVTVVGPDRVDELLPLWAQLSDHHESIRPPYLPRRRDPAESFALLRPQLTGDDSVLLRASGGYVHGYVSGGFDVWDTGRVGAIETLVVAASARGRGVGRALLAAAFDVLRARRAQAVELDVLEGNERAHRFYARVGLRREFESLYLRL